MKITPKIAEALRKNLKADADITIKPANPIHYYEKGYKALRDKFRFGDIRLEPSPYPNQFVVIKNPHVTNQVHKQKLVDFKKFVESKLDIQLKVQVCEIYGELETCTVI